MRAYLAERRRQSNAHGRAGGFANSYRFAWCISSTDSTNQTNRRAQRRAPTMPLRNHVRCSGLCSNRLSLWIPGGCLMARGSRHIFRARDDKSLILVPDGLERWPHNMTEGRIGDAWHYLAQTGRCWRWPGSVNDADVTLAQRPFISSSITGSLHQRQPDHSAAMAANSTVAPALQI